MDGGMAFEEKSAWTYLLVSISAYSLYASIVLGRGDGSSLAEVRYVPTMLWTIGGAIVASIVLHIAITIASPKGADKRDERDKQIYRFGEYVGQSFVVIGGVGALIMSMAELDHFWIANTIYLTFVLSAILGSVAKIVAYRRGFQRW